MIATNNSSPSSHLGIGADDDSSTSHQSHVVAKTPPTSVSKEGQTKKVNNSAPAQGSKLTRPIGMKSAKKLAKLEEESARTKQSLASGVASMPATFATATEGIMGVTQDLVAAFNANTVLKKQDLRARREDKWMRMAELYFSCWEKEKGLALLARLECTGSADVPPSSIGVDASSGMDSAIEVLDTKTLA
jgi:hypothetical protein